VSLKFSEFYQGYNFSNLENGDKVFFKPNIPSKKLANAIKAYGPHVKEEDVYILADETIFGKADNGMLVTNLEIITKEPFENANKVRLEDMRSFTFGGMLGGNFILNENKLISFTQLSKADKKKLSDCLSLFLEEKQKIHRSEIVKEKELEEVKEREEINQTKERLSSLPLSEIISSEDNVLIRTFIQTNNLTPLRRLKTTIHDRPDLFLNNENALNLKLILQKTSINSSALENVIELMYIVFNLPEVLDQIEKNEVFEILMVQNKVIVTLFIAMKNITCGYLTAILDYMPEDRASEIVQRYEVAFNLVISQFLMSLASNENLGVVLRKTQKLMNLDPNSDEALVENNRIMRMLKEANRDTTMDMLVRGIKDVLAVDLHEIVISEEIPEDYSFTNVIISCSTGARFFIFESLNQLEGADFEDIEYEVDTVFEYLQSIIKAKFSKIYL